ncbi:MAG: hypothetical protein C0622_05890 [Desulfuromonas sp.]|nr:MAG: hypothetical protein C0622_05890 [Desulfuromonas sp.]
MYENNQIYTSSKSLEIGNTFFRKVYLWMTAGLGTTALAAFLMLSSETALKFVFADKMNFYILIFAELGLVIALSAAINRISARTATLMFLAYSALNGVTFAAIFLVYTRSSIASVFLITAGTFAAMSLYGYVTKRDLTGLGSFLTMGLFGIIIASIVNMFMHNEMIHWIVGYIGVFIFVGLTAYDTQRLKQIGAAGFADEQQRHKLAIIGALRLYLDFINLFLMLLRVMGNRR